MMNYLLVFSSGFLCTIFLVPRIRKFSLRRRLVDRQDHRKVHKKIITRLGGIAIYLAFIVAMGLAFLLERGPAMEEFISKFIAMLVGGTIILALGIYDDVKGADAWKKLSVQIIAAVVLVIFGFKIVRINNLFGQVVDLGFLVVPLTIIWIIGVTNAINIIDGVDGLAAGVVTIVSVTLFAVSFSQKNIPLAFMGAALAGTTLGFLRYNFSPAKIFMGDTGSMFLGFIIAVMAIQFNRKSTVTLSMLIPIIVLGVPIIDTLSAVIRRALQGAHIFRGDNGHIHHRLLVLGLSQKQVAIVLYFITILLGVVAFACTFLRDRYAAILLVGVALVATVAVRRLGLITFSLTRSMQQGNGSEGKTASIQPILTFKKVMITSACIIVVIPTILLFKAWNDSFDSIENILTYSGRYGQRETDIIGWTKNAFTSPSLGTLYKISDGTGTIWVISGLDRAPNKFLHIKAVIEPNGSRSPGPILYERQRISIWSSLNSFGKRMMGDLLRLGINMF